MQDDFVDLVFHGLNYNLGVTADEQNAPEGTLAVDLEETASGQTWHGEFTAPYVENITTKTGSFKRFGVFVKMLLGALRQQSDTVFLDLLTYADLEALKAKKAGQPAPAAGAPKPGSNIKRYLILTYVVEFDRVHYPLPLVLEEAPTVASQARLIRRLRRELSDAKASGGGAGATRPRTGSAPPDWQYQLDTARQAAALGEEALEKLRAASRAEVKRLRAELAAVSSSLEQARALAGNTSTDTATRERDANLIAQLKETNEQLRAKVQQLTRDLALAASGGAGARAGSSTAARTPTSSSVNRGRTMARTNSTPTSAARAAVPSRGSSLNSRGSSVGSTSAARRVPTTTPNRAAATPTSRGPTPSRTGTSTAMRTPSNGPRATQSASSAVRSGGSHGPVRQTSASRTPITPSSAAKLTAASKAYGMPVARTGGIHSRSTTPGRGSLVSAASAGPVPKLAVKGTGPTSNTMTPGRAAAAAQIALAAKAGLSPITARIYTMGPMATATSRSVSPSSRSRGGSPTHARHGPAMGGLSPTASIRKGDLQTRAASSSSSAATASLGPLGSFTSSTGRAYEKGGVEAILARMDVQSLSRLHQSPTHSRQGASPRGRSPGLPSRVPIGAPNGSAGAPRLTSNGALPSPGRASPAAPALVQLPAAPKAPAPVMLAPPATVASSVNGSTAGGSVGMPSRPVSAATGGSGRYDASADIGDIDARLAQLQDFLKAAKTGAPLPELNVVGLR